MTNKEIPPPKNWGDDLLTQNFNKFRLNQFATFANMEQITADLIEIDKLFYKLLNKAVNPEPQFPFKFFYRAHSAYRASAGLVMAGQLFEAHAILRVCLEHSAYGLYIGDNEERYKIWSNRHENQKAKQAVKDEFTNGKIKKYIKVCSKKIGSIYERLYEELIDFGAHPNEKGFSMNSEILKENKIDWHNTIYLHNEPEQIKFTLKMVGQVGLTALHLAQLIYPLRYEILGIKYELEELRKRY